MYALRLGEVLPHRDLDTLRGIEGARVKAIYKLRAQEFGIAWEGRRYDRFNPDATDLTNQAINHAATAVQAAAAIAVQRSRRCRSLDLSTRIPDRLSYWMWRTCFAMTSRCPSPSRQ